MTQSQLKPFVSMTSLQRWAGTNSCKRLLDDVVAIQKSGMWHYFSHTNKAYHLVMTSLNLLEEK